MSKLIAITGFAGSGKSTAAEYFVKQKSFLQESFAKPLKEAVSAIFNWPVDLLSGDTNESRIWREQEDFWWSKRLDKPGLTPRNVLQNFGTELMRNQFAADIWLASLEARINNSNKDIVVSDCRFPNEIAAIKQHGGKVLWIQRGPLPIWYDCAINELSYFEKNGEQIHKSQSMAANYPKVHKSEWGWLTAEVDFIIHNNNGVEELHKQLDQFLLTKFS